MKGEKRKMDRPIKMEGDEGRCIRRAWECEEAHLDASKNRKHTSRPAEERFYRTQARVTSVSVQAKNIIFSPKENNKTDWI